MTRADHLFRAQPGYIPLADTGLAVKAETDSAYAGDEFLVGLGKTARDGIHLKAAPTADTCDLIVSNVLIMDPILGIRRASIGIRSGRVHAVGRAGNPDTMDGVEVIAGSGTTIIAGDGLIATPGAVDTHVHLVSPRIMEAALASGVTTVISQNFGPTWGCGITSRTELRHAFRAFDAWPVNIGVLARGSSSASAPLVAAIAAGASGLKVHEDFGAHPRALDTALTVADEHDVQVALHSDGLNEFLSVEDTLAVLDGRTIHAFHVEGCGGGHIPNVLELAGVPNVIGSSTNPTLPYGRDTVAEHLQMIMSVHGLTGDSGAALAHARIRAGTMGAEGILHDEGVIPITSSDSQAMGRAGETFRRTFAVAAKMKAELGSEGDTDNERVLRYLAKLTINPALAHGLADEVGTLTPGRLADLVLWDPRFFAAKPDLVLKAGYPAYGVTGDPNASTESCEPLVLGPQFGSYGETAADLSVAFTSGAAHEAAADHMTTRRRRVPVRGTRHIGLASMIRNNKIASVRVSSATGLVTLNGVPVSSPPAQSVPLSRLYFL